MESVGGAFDSSPGTAGPTVTIGGKRGNTTVGVTLSAGPARSLSLAVAEESDPYALLYSTPAHQPPSLARRRHGTETLFNYYTQRGYKEMLNEAATMEAARAVQTCLDAGVDSNAPGATAVASPTAAQRQLSSGKSALSTTTLAPSRNTRTIDRCLVSVAAPLPPVAGGTPAATTAAAAGSSALPFFPLRPAEANDNLSVYRTQRTVEARVAAEVDRRERLRHTPEAAIYLGRYYPEGTQVVQDVQDRLASLRASPPLNATGTAGAGAGGGVGAGTGRKPGGGGGVNSSPSSVSVAGGATTRGSTFPLPGGGGGGAAGNRAQSNSLSGARAIAEAKKLGSLSGPSLAPVWVPTPEETKAQLLAQQEGRHALADQFEDAFVAAYHLRDPAAAQRQREREAAATQRRSTATAAAMLAGTRGTSAASRKSGGGGAKKKKSAAPPAPVKREGGIVVNLELFRTSLLLVCSEEGAVTLEQLRALLADVPFHVGTTNAVLTGSDAARSVNRFFHMLHPSTRAPNTTDATDLLLAVANATSGGSPARPNNHGPDNSFSVGTHNNNNAGNSFSRASNVNMNHSNSNATRRGPGGSTTQAASGNSRGQLPSMSAPLHVSSPTVATPLHPGPAASAAPSSGATLVPTWNDVPSTASQGRAHAHKPAEGLYDGRRCVLAVEVLDALDALLNSPTTRRVVRWECFNVLGAEGGGYIHKSQLERLRRLAYRDGSAAEEQAVVTAAMVKALSDVFSIVALEEEAAYVKANKKGKKKAGAPALAAHQSSPIPLNVMRKSHIDYPTFCRFFDEIPLLAAVYAHVWLPMLVSGRRHGGAAGAGNDGGTAVTGWPSSASSIGSLVGNGPLLVEVSPPSDDDGENDSEMASQGRHAQSQLNGAPLPDEDDPNVQPLELLGATTEARQAAVQWLVAERQEQLHQACDAQEKERLLAMQNDSSSNAFAETQSVSLPVASSPAEA